MGLAVGALCPRGFPVGLPQKQPEDLPAAAFALGLMPFLEARFHIYAAPISWAGWAGPVQGIELSLTHGVAFSMLVASGGAKSPSVLRLALALIFIAFAVSTVASGTHMELFFTGWEILRTVLVYLAVLRACVSHKDAALGLMNGLITGIVVQAITASYQYATGDLQAPGWFGHQNLLGFVSHFVVLPAFAAFLGGYYRRRMLLALA